MNKKEKLLELLQKKNLSKEEKLLIERLKSEDEEVRGFYSFYENVQSLVKSSSHLSSEQMRDYVLYKNRITPEDKNILKSIPFLESHLRECEKCAKDFKTLNQEYNEIGSFTASEFSAEEPSRQNISIKQRNTFLRYGAASVFIIVLLYVSFFIISKFTTPKYYDLVSVDKTTDFYVTRGRATDAFQKSLLALEEDNFDEAIDYLKQDINNSADDQTVFYSHYILGLIYLEKSRVDFIGLFPHFKEGNAEKALSHFEAAIQKNKSGQFNNITLDAYFYSAKADLILNNFADAHENLRIVVNKKGGKMDEARKLLREIE